MKFALLIAFLAFYSCSHTSKKSTFSEFNDKTLQESGVKAKASSTAYPYEEFFKTSGIRQFDFRPDKKGVYFLKNDGKVDNIFEYDIEAKTIRQITFYPEMVLSYLVDPKGRYLYFMQDKGGSELYDLYRFDLKSKRTLRLTDGKNKERSYLCDITEDGSKLYYSETRDRRSKIDIKVMDTNSLKKDMVKIANKEEQYCVMLSDDDQIVSFMNYVENNEIYSGVIDLKDNSVTMILEEKNVKAGAPIIINDTAYFVSNSGSDILRPWKFDLKKKSLEKLNVPVSNELAGFAISGKGKVSTIRYRGELTPEFKIYRGLFESELNVGFPSENIKGANFDEEDPELGVITIQEGAAPHKYYLYQGGKTELIYNSNQSILTDADFSSTYSTFVKSFDGLKVPAHFFIPHGTSSQNKRPVIFWIHGGPEDHVDPEYSPRLQYMLSQGFIIVAPNVRGSTGFGKSYQYKDNGDWGGGHIKDIVAVAEYTRSLEFVDAKNLFIIGGSFGGFSVMSLITQYPEVFRAAVDIFGLIELASFMESWTPLQQNYWLSELGADPRKNEEFNRRVSPLYHLENIKIPLQVHQGANDIRVEKSQSDKLVARMKELGKPVEYHVYPDEGHGFTKFNNAQACYERSLNFFKAHVAK